MDNTTFLLSANATLSDNQMEELQERIDIIRHKLKYVESRPAVICIENLEPLMVSGNWIPEMVNVAGGMSLLGEAGKDSPVVKWEDIRQADPEIIVVMPRGFPIGRTMREMNLLLSQPDFAELKAVKNNHLYIADGEKYFNQPGPQIVDCVEIMAEIIHPKLFNFGFEGDGWIKFSF